MREYQVTTKNGITNYTSRVDGKISTEPEDKLGQRVFDVHRDQISKLRLKSDNKKYDMVTTVTTR